METRTKENDLQVKGKRGTSPSIPRLGDPMQRRKSSSPAASEKQFPNYLKPTLSSRLDPSSKPTVKKQPSIDKQPNQLTRRKSFDKPPSPSRVPKPQSSTTSPNSLRSSSFSSKTNPLPKPSFERQTKATKDVGKNTSQLQPRSSNVKKSNITTSTTNKKQYNASNSTNLTTKVAKRTNTPSTVLDSAKLEPEEKYQESLPIEAEEIVENNMPDEIQKLEEDKEHNEDVKNEDEVDQGEEEINLCDSSTIIEDHSAPLSVDLKETNQVETNQTIAKENGDNHQEIEEHKKEEYSDDTFPSEQCELDGEKKEIGEEVTSVSSKEEVNGNKEAMNCEEIPQAEKVGEGWKVEDALSSIVKKSQGCPQGKKDTTAYNDVIEETASKLREQRKNKVKALVGAFETVISLESETTPE